MARTKLDAVVAVLSRVSGRSEDELFIELKTMVIPKMKDPSGLYAEISEDEYKKILASSKKEQAGILKWMLEGAAKDPLGPPPN